MHDLLTDDEDKQAAAQGWGLHYVYDLASKVWSLRILPTQSVNHVVNMARMNHPLPQKALQLMAHYGKK